MSSASDFDFLIGDWTVSHQRLRERLVGADDWDAFPGTASCRKILGGLGNSDDNLLELPGDPYHAMTVRNFDSVSEEWSIWWFDGRFPASLEPPVRGSFQGGVGTFYAKDTYGGRPILVRFLWHVKDGETPRWEQAFSADDGASWETNWTMDFDRLARAGT
jgi:hypothetical protein